MTSTNPFLTARRASPIALSLTLSLASLGCGGYSPVRWPSRELWMPSKTDRPPIDLPSQSPDGYPDRVAQDQVTVVAQLIDRQQSIGMFHADLVGQDVQPVMIIVRNESDQPYLFEKAQVDGRYLPASTVARRAYVHPVVTLARLAKWIIWLVPGAIIESLIEPSTLEFPNIEEAARRPSAPNNAGIRAAFVQSEIVDGPVQPQSTRAGLIFLRPQKLGRPIRLTLVHASTRRPLLFDVRTPPPFSDELRQYPQPYDLVWQAAVQSARNVSGWHIRMIDESRGIVTVRRGGGWFFWVPRTRMVITVQPFGAGHTWVKLEGTLRRLDSTALGEHVASGDRFFDELGRRLPAPPPPPKPAAVSAHTASSDEPSAPESSPVPAH